MSNQQQQLTEAIWALTNELRLFREQPPAAPTKEPSHTGAAPVTSGEFEAGDWVRVDDTELPFYGQAGVVRMVGEDEYGDWCTVDFADMASRRLYQASLERTQKPTPLPPRH